LKQFGSSSYCGGIFSTIPEVHPAIVCVDQYPDSSEISKYLVSNGGWVNQIQKQAPMSFRIFILSFIKALSP